MTWSHVEREGREWLRIIWQECDSRAFARPPPARGFGLALIESVLPDELGAGTRVSWPSPGARIEIEIPADHRAPSWTTGARAAS